MSDTTNATDSAVATVEPAAEKKSKRTAKTKTAKPVKTGPKSQRYGFLLTRPRDIAGIEEMYEAIVKGETPNPNDCVVSRSEYKQRWDAFEAAVKNDKKAVPPGNLYDPITIGYGMGDYGHEPAMFAFEGQKGVNKRQPKDWQPSVFGDWRPGMKLERFRSNHIHDVRKAVRDADVNLVTVGQSQYIVGTIGDNAIPAIHLINASRGEGNYAHNLSIGKREVFVDAKIANLVGRINNRLTRLTLEDGSETLFAPNQMVTWGYLERDGNRLTCNQIRSLTEDDKGVRFVELDNPIVGTPVAYSKIWSGVKRAMSLVATKDEDGQTAMDRFAARPRRGDEKGEADKALAGQTNLFTVQTRLSPSKPYCFGFRNLQVGIIPFVVYNEDGSERLINFAIGARLATNLEEKRQDLKARLGANATETKTKKVKTPKSKPAKVEKVKAEKSEKTEKPVKTAKKKATSSSKTRKNRKQKTNEAPAVVATSEATDVIELVDEPIAEPISESIDTADVIDRAIEDHIETETDPVDATAGE